MTATPVIARAQAPGKIILFGEHAVVYGRPAIAAPVQQVHAYAEILPAKTCIVEALDLDQTILVAHAPDDNPFARIVNLVCETLGEALPPWRIRITSEIPIAAGLGSGAAISAAIVRAMLAAFGESLSNEMISALVFEVEKLHHGTPSGIDNTVVVYERPVWFTPGEPPQPFAVERSIDLLIADTGAPSPTRAVVGDVRRAWQRNTGRYEALFDVVGEIVHRARITIESGDINGLGVLMNKNQDVLVDLGVSSPELDRLVLAAREHGALGAKLSGAGRGGHMIALVNETDIERVTQALLAFGATSVIHTTIQPAGMI